MERVHNFIDLHTLGLRAERFVNIRHLRLQMLYTYDPLCWYMDDISLEHFEEWKQLWRLVGTMRLETLAVSMKYPRCFRAHAILGLESVSIVPLLEIHGIKKASLVIESARHKKVWALEPCERHNQLEEDVLQRWRST